MSMTRVMAAVLIAATAAGCGGDTNAAFKELSDARNAAGDLQVAFIKATDAANRAVMAQADAASVAYASEANAEKQDVRRGIDRIRPLLDALHYDEEARILREFESRFAAYDKLDRQILDLAVENSNLTAQRLSFDAGQSAADAFRDALQTLAAGHAADAWRVKATTAAALAAVREIQVMQAPHIADLDDASMTRIEARMAAAEKIARDALASLPALVDTRTRPAVETATASLNRFVEVNARIVALSRRNTNVRSIALSLDQKQQVIPPCRQSLQALREALDRRGHRQGRWGA